MKLAIKPPTSAAASTVAIMRSFIRTIPKHGAGREQHQPDATASASHGCSIDPKAAPASDPSRLTRRSPRARAAR